MSLLGDDECQTLATSSLEEMGAEPVPVRHFIWNIPVVVRLIKSSDAVAPRLVRCTRLDLFFPLGHISALPPLISLKPGHPAPNVLMINLAAVNMGIQLHSVRNDAN